MSLITLVRYAIDLINNEFNYYFIFVYLDHKRFYTASMFKRTLPIGEIGDWKWVMYSIKQGSIYCFMCKLFSRHFNSPLVSKGFDKWKKKEKLSEHENNIDHRSAFTKWLLRSNSNHSINKEMLEKISSETKYWNDVVTRVISVN